MHHNCIRVGNTDISFTEKNSNGSITIFFIHGNSCTARFWRKQFTSSLSSKYRMIAFDLPWHGRSGFPDWSNCSLPALGRIMSDAVKGLHNGEPYVLVGASLGTNIVAEMLYYDLNPTGMILAGPCLFGKDQNLDEMIQKGTHVDVVFARHAPPEDVSLYARETSLSRDPLDLITFLEDYKNTHEEFRPVFAASLKNYNDEIEIFRKKNTPSLVVFGADEKIVFPHYLDGAGLPVWRGLIYKLKGASHLVNIDQPEAFNDLMASYLADIFI